MQKLSKNKGFTLIEVVIVLAIAALIILVVLQAVSAAQKSQRDNGRKQVAGQAVSYLEQYASNNGGNYPVDAASFGTIKTSYGNNTDLTTKNYTMSISGAAYVAAGAAWDPGCPAQTANTYVLEYKPQNTVNPNTDYDLAVCLETGGYDVVHQ